MILSQNEVIGHRSRADEGFGQHRLEKNQVSVKCLATRWPPTLRHAWFGGGRLEKGLHDKYLAGLLPSAKVVDNSVAAYPIARRAKSTNVLV